MANRGTSRIYLLARLQRERPDLVRKLKLRKITSVHAAAIAAGYLTAPSTGQTLRRAWNRARTEERQEFLAWIRVHDGAALLQVATGPGGDLDELTRQAFAGLPAEEQKRLIEEEEAASRPLTEKRPTKRKRTLVPKT